MSRSEEIAEIARRIAEDTGGFTGGGIGIFENVGRMTLRVLRNNGLKRQHRLLDVGCGTLRLGYWLVRYLKPDRYCGIEPSEKFVAAGRKHALGAELDALKRPRFHHNSDFDFSVFGVKFDYVVARSVFSHTSPKLLAVAMDSFRANSSDDAVMLMSYRPLENTEKSETGHLDRDGKGADWALNRYSLDYMHEMARARGMFAENFGKQFNGQRWLRLSRREKDESA